LKKSKIYIIAACGSWNMKLFKNNNFPKNFIFVSNNFELRKKLTKLKPKYIFFLHWHSKIPKNIYTKFECIGMHMTDLPYGRGGSPLQNLIIRNHQKTKLSAFKINKTIDGGPIYLKRSLKLSGNAHQIYRRLTLLSFKIINKIISEEIQPKEQIGKITLFKRRKPKQSLIKNNMNIEEIYNFIRMLDAPGYPRAYLSLKHLKLKISNVQKSKECLNAKIEIVKK